MARNDLTGTLFAERYRLERKLGSGGMADVWLAEDQELGRRVAVKILHERYANDAQFVERFRREATHAAGLSHPNIVSIYDRGVADGSYYIVMEYIEGRTLKELIVTRGPCPMPVAISYTRQILAALRYAHKNGIIHRDIKPHNVIVDREGRVKVADFGIARAGASEMTEAGSIVGTAQYLSPEQARGAPVDESSDLYSTGIVLYELLTGAVPFTGETPVEIAMKHLSQTPEAPSAIRPEISRDLDLVVLRALAKEPSDRYRSAAELDRDLELVARGDAVGTETETAATMVLAGAGALDATAATRVAARTPGGEGRTAATSGTEPTTGRRSRRRSIWPWLLALGAVLAVAVGGWFLYDNVQNQIDDNKPLRVQQYTGIVESKAVNLILDDGFEPKVSAAAEAATRPSGSSTSSQPSRGRASTRGNRHDPGLDGEEDRKRARVVGKQLTDAVATPDTGRPEREERRRPVGQAVQHRHGPGSEVGDVSRRGSHRPHQLLDWAEAGRRAARRRARLLDGAPAAPGRRLRRRADGRRERPAGRRRREPGAERNVDRHQGLDGQPLGLERATDDAAARRDRPDRGRCEGDADRGRLQGEGDSAGHRRGDVRQGRDLAGSAGEHAAGPEHGRNALRRRLRSAAATTPTDRPTPRRTRRRPRRRRDPRASGGRACRRTLERARDLPCVGAIRRRGARPGALRDAGDRDRTGRRLGAPARSRGHCRVRRGGRTLPIPTAAAPAALGAVDVVLPILHGPFGEDGTVQGLLELAGVPYVGSGVTASALCMDKDLFKAVLRDRGIPVAPNITLRPGDAVENPFGYPVFVKPARLGSSVGISKVGTVDELEAAVELARRHDDKVLVEEFQPGVEVEVGVLGNRDPIASVVGEIVAHADWYDFDAKYQDGGMDLIIPARLRRETLERVQELAVASFVATDCEGMARVDFFVRPDGEVVVNELNTIPGFTSTSVYAKLFDASGIPYAELLDRLVGLALERHAQRSKLEY